MRYKLRKDSIIFIRSIGKYKKLNELEEVDNELWTYIKIRESILNNIEAYYEDIYELIKKFPLKYWELANKNSLTLIKNVLGNLHDLCISSNRFEMELMDGFWAPDRIEFKRDKINIKELLVIKKFYKIIYNRNQIKKIKKIMQENSTLYIHEEEK